MSDGFADLDRLSIGMTATALISDLELAESALEKDIPEMAGLPIGEAKRKANEILELLNGVGHAECAPTITVRTGPPVSGECPWCHVPAGLEGECPKCGFEIEGDTPEGANES